MDAYIKLLEAKLNEADQDEREYIMYTIGIIEGHKLANVEVSHDFITTKVLPLLGVGSF